MDKAHHLSSPMVVRSLDVKKDHFHPKDDDEVPFGPEVLYLSAIGALIYLTSCTQPDIAFPVNLLARYSYAPTRRQWNRVKHILSYLRGTADMGLFYPHYSNPQLVGYADQVIFLIRIKADHRQGICSLTAILLFHGVLSSKQYLLLP